MARKPRHYSGGNLRRMRRLMKLQQTDVAKRFGLKNTAIISRWERGEVLPNLENAFMLAKLYRVMVDELFYEVGVSCRKKLFPDETTIITRKKR